MFRKLVALILTLILVVSLAACAGTGSTDAAGTGDGVTEITFWHSMDGIPGSLVQKQLDAFNAGIGAEKKIHVTGVFQDWPGTDALTAAISTDDAENMPDVIQLYSENVDLVADWKRTEWVEDYIGGQGSAITKEDLVPNAVSAYTLNGRLLGAPYAISTLALYYNKDLLAQAGYDAPPATIAEMAEMMTAIKEKTQAAYALNARITQFEFESFIATQGKNGTYFGNNESGRSGKMTELACENEIDAFLTQWDKVVKTGALKPTKDSMNEEFAQGLNAMALMSTSQIPTVTELVGDSFEWGVAPIPTVNADDVGGGFPSGSALFMIDRDDEAKRLAAWEFVQYMLSAQAQSMWLDGYCYVPVNVNAAQTEEYKTAVQNNPLLAVPSEILQTVPNTVVASFCPNSSEVGGVIKDKMIEFGNGSLTKEETFDAIMNGIASAFENYFRANPID